MPPILVKIMGRFKLESSSVRHAFNKVKESSCNPICVLNCLLRIIEELEKIDKKITEFNNLLKVNNIMLDKLQKYKKEVSDLCTLFQTR